MRPPITITQEIIKLAEELAERGLTNAQIAHHLGMGESTFYEKKNEFPEFSEACERGKAKGIQQVASALFEKALSGDVRAMMFYLSRVAGWLENKPAESPTIIINLDADDSRL